MTISQKRVYVEQVIRVLKIFRLAKEQFRLRAGMYEQAIGCVCGERSFTGAVCLKFDLQRFGMSIFLIFEDV